jgi:NADH-quinone oxidoreductase subunit H
VLFLISALAENNRLPFDLPEAEAELTAGYHTEYSAMKFSMFYIAEYAAVITMCALISTLFFGGWDVPFTHWDEGPPSLARFVVTLLAFSAKTGFFLFTYIWIRWTLPRFRFDQLMELGWKVMLPVALGYIMVVAFAVYGLERAGLTLGLRYGAVLTGINVVLTAVLLWGLDRGRLLAGSRRQGRPRMAA